MSDQASALVIARRQRAQAAEDRARLELEAIARQAEADELAEADAIATFAAIGADRPLALPTSSDATTRFRPAIEAAIEEQLAELGMPDRAFLLESMALATLAAERQAKRTDAMRPRYIEGSRWLSARARRERISVPSRHGRQPDARITARHVLEEACRRPWRRHRVMAAKIIWRLEQEGLMPVLGEISGTPPDWLDAPQLWDADIRSALRGAVSALAGNGVGPMGKPLESSRA